MRPTIARQAAAPLLVLLACTACGAGQDPLAPADIASRSTPLEPGATSNPNCACQTCGQAQHYSDGSGDVAARRAGSVSSIPPCRVRRGDRAPTLGRLGTGPLNQRVAEIERMAKPYAAGREILPVVEVIATVVQASPGRDGKYRVRLSDAQIAAYHKAARKYRAVLLLNLQPGRSEFLAEARAFEKWLKQPDVGVALDPEWAMDPGQRPEGCMATRPAPSWTVLLIWKVW